MVERYDIKEIPNSTVEINEPFIRIETNAFGGFSGWVLYCRCPDLDKFVVEQTSEDYEGPSFKPYFDRKELGGPRVILNGDVEEIKAKVGCVECKYKNPE